MSFFVNWVSRDGWNRFARGTKNWIGGAAMICKISVSEYEKVLLNLRNIVTFMSTDRLIDLKSYLSLQIWFCARWKKVFAHNAYFILVLLLNVFSILPIHFQNEKHHIFLFTWKGDTFLNILQSDTNKWFQHPSNIEFYPIDFSSRKKQQFSGFLMVTLSSVIADKVSR